MDDLFGSISSDSLPAGFGDTVGSFGAPGELDGISGLGGIRDWVAGRREDKAEEPSEKALATAKDEEARERGVEFSTFWANLKGDGDGSGAAAIGTTVGTAASQILPALLAVLGPGEVPIIEDKDEDKDRTIPLFPILAGVAILGVVGTAVVAVTRLGRAEGEDEE